MDGKNAQTAVNMMQAVKALAGENDTTTDMFGFDDGAMREAEEMAKIAAQKQREVQTRLSAITGAARNPAVAKAEGIDIKDPEAVKRRIDELRQMKAGWDNWSTNPQLVAEVRAARGVAAPSLKPVLQTQTSEELRQKAEQEAAAAKRDAEEKRKAEEKAKADEEAGEFVLTGSDRAADEAAARGQTDIFGAATEEEAAAEEAKEEKPSIVNRVVRIFDSIAKTETYEQAEGMAAVGVPDHPDRPSALCFDVVQQGRQVLPGPVQVVHAEAAQIGWAGQPHAAVVQRPDIKALAGCERGKWAVEALRHARGPGDDEAGLGLAIGAVVQGPETVPVCRRQ
jgi:hypothetical protein